MSKVCSPYIDTSISLEPLDTTFVIAGLRSHVVIMKRKGIRFADYYYCDSVNIDPAQYACHRADGLDILYKFTKGGLITQVVQYDSDLYNYATQLTSIRRKSINDSVFDIPKGIKIVEQK